MLLQGCLSRSSSRHQSTLPFPRPLGPTRISPKLTIRRATVPVPFPSLPLAVAALVVVVVVDQIIGGGGRCTRGPSPLQSAWLLMLPPSSIVLPRLSSQTCPLLLLSSLPSWSLYHFHILGQRAAADRVAAAETGRPGSSPGVSSPHPRGIYLFSVIFDTSKVCSTCTAAEPLILLPLLLFVLCLPWPVCSAACSCTRPLTAH